MKKQADNAVKADIDMIREYIAERRMCSAENLSLRFGIPLNKLFTVIRLLTDNNLVRIAQKNCGNTCGTCTSECSSDGTGSTSIIISLEMKENEDVG